ncbi:MAG: ATP synthase subunit C [Acutalibacteraceae bacterium]|nr:ATP synthase subunit C [Acutalibacteraceae bacterium]
MNSDNGKGLGLLAAAIVTGLSGVGGGIAVAAGAPAAIAATSEDAKAFGKALIFVALGESIALYGVVISILILNKI